MVDPDRTLLILNEIRAEIRAMRAQMTSEFSEIHDRLRRMDERLDGLVPMPQGRIPGIGN